MMNGSLFINIVDVFQLKGREMKSVLSCPLSNDSVIAACLSKMRLDCLVSINANSTLHRMYTLTAFQTFGFYRKIFRTVARYVTSMVLHMALHSDQDFDCESVQKCTMKLLNSPQ